MLVKKPLKKMNILMSCVLYVNLVNLANIIPLGQVPEPVGWALMPVAPIGELFGWLFALELQNSQAGFKLTGKHVCTVFCLVRPDS